MAVAKIGTTTYPTLAAAFASDEAKVEGAKIELLDNVGLTEELDIVDFNGTLDLGGFELSNDESYVTTGFDWLIDLYVSDATKTSSLTITNGTVTLQDGHMFYVCAGATLTVAADATINEVAIKGCANPFRTYGKIGGHTGESSDIPCTVNVYGTMTRVEAEGNDTGCESGVIDQCLGTSVVNVYDGAVLTHANGRLFKMSGGTPTVNVYGGTMTAGGELFHAYGTMNYVDFSGGNLTGTTIFSNGNDAFTADKLEVTGLGDGCEAKFSTTVCGSKIGSLADLCDDGYMPALVDGWYVIKAARTVTLKNGDEVVDTQVVADGQCATNVVLDVEGFKGWTNETYTAAFDFTTAITADTTLFAWIEATPATPVANVTIGGVTTPYTDLHDALVAGSGEGAFVELIGNINLAGKTWEPIVNFKGTFDGAGYTISNLYIEKDTGDNVGLFGNTNREKEGSPRPVVKNLVIDGIYVNAPNSQFVGGIVGHSFPLLITNVTVRGNIKIAGKKYVGGIDGHPSATIIDCKVIGDGAATSFIGANTTEAAQVGGIYGMGAATEAVLVYNCSVEGVTIQAKEHVGGIGGRMQGDAINVNCSVKDVIVKGGTNVGSLIGQPYGYESATCSDYLLNCTADNVALQDAAGVAIADAEYGTSFGSATQLNFVKSSDAVGAGIAAPAGKTFGLTGGTFTIVSEWTSKPGQAVANLAAQCATGYAPIANLDGTYTITQVHTVTLKNGDAVVDTQVVADGQCATNVVLDVAGFKGWTNETYTAAFDFATAIEADITLFAWIEAAGPVYPQDLPEEFPADADQAVKDKYVDWAKTYGVTDATGLSDAFLMNADPNGTIPTLKIESIAVEGDTATIVVSAEGVDLEKGINGKLYVSGCNDLGGEWATTDVELPKSFNDGAATFTVDAAKFMKAKVGFKVEEAPVK